MKHVMIIPLLIYVLASGYIFIRGWQLLPQNAFAKVVYCFLFLVLWTGYVVGMLGRNTLPVPLVKWLCLPGGTAMLVMMYLLIALLVIDLVRIANYFFHFFPGIITENVYRARLFTAGGLFLILTVILGIGYFKFTHPAVRTLEIDVDKQANGRKELNIAAISDLHLGFTIGKDRLKQYVDQINALHPDIIVISGDLIDVSTRPLELYRMYEELQQLKAPLGVYMVTGNHEYISGIESSIAFIKKTGIRLLEDEFVLPDSTFILIGQNDMFDLNRKSFENILIDSPSDLPVIGLCHQPNDANLESAEKNGIDLLFCGHTHQGQVWPGNLLVDKLFKVPYGYGRMGNTNIYVSSGLGLWGPQFRIGTQSEIALIKLKFKA